MSTSDRTSALLRLTLVEGVGPILGRRLIAAYGSAEHVFGAAPADLERIDGIGTAKARKIHSSMLASAETLERELTLAEKLGVRLIALGDPEYPPLLAEAPDAPLVLYVKGAAPCPPGAYAVAIVGSRHCTAYGVEQAERFSAALAQAGLIIVSGGARGIDSAAHRAAIRVNGTTVVVMGCGLANCYPPENAPLFEDIASRGGTVLSELPLTTTPSPDNFPARNRIVTAMCLGVLVIEAPAGSGALITARLAIDDYNREVMAVPGRVDSRASEGSNRLIQSGEAAVVLHPSDVIDLLEAAARHQFEGSHAARFGNPPEIAESLWPPGAVASGNESRPIPGFDALTDPQRAIVEALAEPATVADLCRRTGIQPAELQAETTMLEIRRVVLREGSRFRLRKA